MTAFRMATFNCENLFSRPRLFEASDTKSAQVLKDFSDLQAELRKATFDQARIKQLETAVKGYARVVDARGNHTTATGANDPKWIGWAELIVDRVNDDAIMNTGHVIADIDADVISLVEVEDRPSLKRFHDEVIMREFLKKKKRPPYEWIMLVDGNDDRGIDVAVMSRHPILSIKSHVNETVTYMGHVTPLYSRDCLEVTIAAPNNVTLHMMINHFKSMRPSKGDPLSNTRRQQQAAAVAKLITSEHNPKKEHLVVCGDFNSDSSSPSLTPLLSVPNMYNVNEELPVGQRGTFGTGKQQLDYLLVSDPMRNALKQVHIERHGVFTKTKWPHYPSVISARTSASDHSAVVADFDLK